MSKSMAEQVYEAVKKDILSCELQPGSVIAQSQLSERYKAGITPIREALQKLVKDGLVTSIPRFGYVVTPITLLDVQELFELRLVMEKAVARLAATRATEEQIKRLYELADYTYIYRDRESYSTFLSSNAQFHLSIARASSNRRMLEVIEQILEQLNRVFHMSLDILESAEERRAEHLALVNAIAQRQPDEAERVIEEQVLRSKQRVLDALMSTPGRESEGPRQSIQVVSGYEKEAEL